MNNLAGQSERNQSFPSQVSVFFNMPTILSNAEWVSRVMSIVVASGIESEERVEVRVKAGAVLSGLLHCQFVGEDKRRELMVSKYNQLQKMFIQWKQDLK